MIDRIDHIVLTTRDKDARCIRFYTEVLGMELVRFRTPTEERLALPSARRKSTCMSGGASSCLARTSPCPDRSICVSSPR